MDYLAAPNVLLEALAYLGARANGNTMERMEERLLARGISDLAAFRAQYAPIQALRQALDREVPIHQSQLDRLFRNLEGFPFSTTGSYSPAFLLFYPMLSHYRGDFDALMEQMAALSPDHVARHLLISLSMEDRLGPDETGAGTLLMECIRSLSVPARSRSGLLTLYQDYQVLLPAMGSCLRMAVTALEQRRPQLDAMAQDFCRELERTGCEAYLRKTSSLSLSKGTQYLLRPFLLGPDTNLSLEMPEDSGHVVIYCGVLRQFLQELLYASEDADSKLFETIKLMGDRTRFDILCYLRDHPAYGQELSEHFGLARNTIHHHMSKLLNAGLVTCTVDGNRIYYAIDREHLAPILRQQQALFLGE